VGGGSSLSLYSFGTEEYAKGFVALTVSQSNCPDGLEYEKEEADDWEDGHINFFLHEGWDGQVWTIVQNISVGSAAGEDADEAFFTKLTTVYMTNAEGVAYGTKRTGIDIYERHGRLVMVHGTSGSCCDYGFSNVETQTGYTPTFDEASASLDILRPHVLDALPDK
jgi:hypothetical protein